MPRADSILAKTSLTTTTSTAALLADSDLGRRTDCRPKRQGNRLPQRENHLFSNKWQHTPRYTILDASLVCTVEKFLSATMSSCPLSLLLYCLWLRGRLLDKWTVTSPLLVGNHSSCWSCLSVFLFFSAVCAHALGDHNRDVASGVVARQGERDQ